MDDPEEDLISNTYWTKKSKGNISFFFKMCFCGGISSFHMLLITILESLRDKIIFIKNNNIENRSVYQAGA